MKHLILIASLLYAPLLSASELIIFAALSVGGDKLAETSEGNEVRAGGLLQFSGGVEQNLSENIIIQSMFGLKFDTATASDGQASFHRFPIDVNLIRRTEKLELSAGFSYHINPKYKVQIDGLGSDTVSFNNAIGPSIGLGLLVNENMNLGLRFTSLDYEVDDIIVDGNSLGLYCSLSF